MSARTVVFDLGGVLVHWDPRLLFADVLEPGEDVDAFLDEIGFAEWNHAQDAGKPWAEAVAEHSAKHPHRAEADRRLPGALPDVRARPDGRDRGRGRRAARQRRTAPGPDQLVGRAVPARCGTGSTFLDDFEGVVVSGDEGLAKPDPALFQVLVERHGVVPAETVYVDDAQRNVDAAAALGFRAHLFTDADTLRAHLVGEGLLRRARLDLAA